MENGNHTGEILPVPGAQRSAELEGVIRDLESQKITPSEALQYLGGTGLYIFHGSNLDLPELTPQKPKYSFDAKTGQYIDEPEAVYGTANPVYATFMALISGVPGRAAVSNKDNEFVYKVSPNKRDNMGERQGFVYVFDRADFQQRNSAEFLSKGPLMPLLKIKVDESMLPDEIEEIEDNPSN